MATTIPESLLNARKDARNAVLHEIHDAGGPVQLLGTKRQGFALDLVEQGYVTCDDDAEHWQLTQLGRITLRRL